MSDDEGSEMASLPWIRIDCAIDTHPDFLEAGPWGLVAFMTLLRIVKERGTRGTISARYCVKKYLAKRSLFDANFEKHLDSGLDACERVGLIIRDSETVTIPGWSRFQRDITNTERQRRHRQKRDESPACNATPRYVTVGHGNNAYETGHDMTVLLGAQDEDAKKEPAPEADRIPWAEMTRKWQTIADDNAAMRGIRLTDATKAAIKARAKGERKPVAEAWEAMLDEVRRSDFLRGERIGSSGRPFQLSLAWVIKPNNWAKIMSGNYADSAQQRAASSPAQRPLEPQRRQPEQQRSRPSKQALDALLSRRSPTESGPVDRAAVDAQRAALLSMAGRSRATDTQESALDAPESTEGPGPLSAYRLGACVDSGAAEGLRSGGGE